MNVEKLILNIIEQAKFNKAKWQLKARKGRTGNNGIDVGGTQAAQLKKIEELNLYII
jgi:hypothetical protein